LYSFYPTWGLKQKERRPVEHQRAKVSELRASYNIKYNLLLVISSPNFETKPS
jgi:hypothetical protein